MPSAIPYRVAPVSSASHPIRIGPSRRAGRRTQSGSNRSRSPIGIRQIGKGLNPIRSRRHPITIRPGSLERDHGMIVRDAGIIPCKSMNGANRWIMMELTQMLGRKTLTRKEGSRVRNVLAAGYRRRMKPHFASPVPPASQKSGASVIPHTRRLPTRKR